MKRPVLLLEMLGFIADDLVKVWDTVKVFLTIFWFCSLGFAALMALVGWLTYMGGQEPGSILPQSLWYLGINAAIGGLVWLYDVVKRARRRIK